MLYLQLRVLTVRDGSYTNVNMNTEVDTEQSVLCLNVIFRPEDCYQALNRLSLLSLDLSVHFYICVCSVPDTEHFWLWMWHALKLCFITHTHTHIFFLIFFHASTIFFFNYFVFVSFFLFFFFHHSPYTNPSKLILQLSHTDN